MRALVPFLVFPLLLIPSVLLAQDLVISTDRSNFLLAEPNFWMAIITGIFLAVAFQLVLTSLSAAIGLSAFSLKPSKRGQESKSPETSITGPKITSAFGLYAMITTAIGLFFASWLGVTLGMTNNLLNGVIVGLVIWGIFMTAMTYLQARAVTSVIGSLMSAASTAVKTTLDVAQSTVSSVFGKSEADKAEDIAGKITSEVRREIFGDADAGDIKSQIQKYVNQLSAPKIDAKSIREELENLLDDVEIRAIIEDPSMLKYEEITASLEMNRGMTRQKARSVTSGIKQAVDSIREERSKDKRPAEKVADTAARVTGMGAEEAEEYRHKIEDYLRSTDKEALNPEGIKADLEKLFESPGEGIDRLKARLEQLDRNTIADIIAQRTDMSQEEAQSKTDAVVNTLTMVKNKIMGAAQGVSGTVTAVSQGTTTTSQGPTTTSQADTQTGATTSADKNSVITKIFDFAHSWQMPDLDYDGIKNDISLIFSDPKAGYEGLKNRLQGVDRETLKKIIHSRKDISDDDAERMVQQMESARDSAIERAERMKDEVENRLKQVRDETLRKADDARKTAMTAAWWVFGTAVVSGVAAVLGAIVAVP